MISQSQINPAQEFTYPKALRSLMRQDPQSSWWAKSATRRRPASLCKRSDGHLIISTIHSALPPGFLRG